jgi:hypothetical protein
MKALSSVVCYTRGVKLLAYEQRLVGATSAQARMRDVSKESSCPGEPGRKEDIRVRDWFDPLSRLALGEPCYYAA